MTINIGDRVRLRGTYMGRIPEGATGTVRDFEGLEGQPRLVRVTWDHPVEYRDHSLPLNETRLERIEAEPEPEGPSPEMPSTVEEWQKKWTDLVLAAHRIADEHDMCSSFEHNVADLGIPPRGRYRREVDFDDQGFETPDLVIEEEEVENEYCVDTRRTVQITVPVTVSVEQVGHGHYRGTSGPEDYDLDWGTVEWGEIESEAIIQALYNETLEGLRYAVHLTGDEEETPDDGTEEIVDWEVSE